MRNCFGSLAKFIVVATNLVVFVAGCVSTGFGVYYLVVDDPAEAGGSTINRPDAVTITDDVANDKFDNDHSDKQQQHLIVATSFSAFVVIVSLFGCIGAWKV